LASAAIADISEFIELLKTKKTADATVQDKFKKTLGHPLNTNIWFLSCDYVQLLLLTSHEIYV